jgi:hypothetical protein
MDTPAPIRSLTDTDIVDRLAHFRAGERTALAGFIETLVEFDRRRLFLPRGYQTLFAYCTEHLLYTPDEAFFRIEAARVCSRYPTILDMLQHGALTLTAIRLLGPHLTEENHERVLKEAAGRKKSDIEQLVASLHPRPPVPSSIRQIPASSGAPARMIAGASRSDEPLSEAALAPPKPRSRSEAPHARRSVTTPLSPEYFKLQVTIGRDAHDALREIQSLIRHTIPNGDPARIVERAILLLLTDLRRRKFADVARPRNDTVATRASKPEKDARSRTRYIPAGVRRRVERRDGGRCRFVSEDGVRCSSKEFLEFHHIKPHARGGRPSAENIQLRCRAHNAYEAELDFGPRARRSR